MLCYVILCYVMMFCVVLYCVVMGMGRCMGKCREEECYFRITSSNEMYIHHITVQYIVYSLTQLRFKHTVNPSNLHHPRDSTPCPAGIPLNDPRSFWKEWREDSPRCQDSHLCDVMVMYLRGKGCEGRDVREVQEGRR
jgi:hypothetical protein